MDDIVIRGMAKWPDVPAVYGWLSLDRRGTWLLKGKPITNPAVVRFIGRNYECDDAGRWFFQNGPQRVYVTLQYTPFVYRIAPSTDGRLELEAHTGQRTQAATSSWIDEEGSILIGTDIGIGLVHDKDLQMISGLLVDAAGRRLDDTEVESRLLLAQQGEVVNLYLRGFQSRLEVRPVSCRDVEKQFGFDAHPLNEERSTAVERSS